jgi:hypothetical protein
VARLIERLTFSLLKTNFQKIFELKSIARDNFELLWKVLFLLLSCDRLIALVDITSKNRYGFVGLLLGGVKFYTHDPA